VFAKSRTITLDTKTKRRIVEMVAVSQLVLAQRNHKLRLVATVFYGLTIGAGYLLVMGVIKSGWFTLATPLLVLAITCWAIAYWIARVRTSKPLKIRIN
jgi:hypothetical protein